ncbi:MAG: hypothetical protein JWQ72_1425 [Polaromonas sp.]|nr:hypothetical protein [Polaromonas sp.]
MEQSFETSRQVNTSYDVPPDTVDAAPPPLDAAELQAWCKRFGCTDQELRCAVSAVGGNMGQLRSVFRVSLGERLETWFRLPGRALRH